MSRADTTEVRRGGDYTPVPNNIWDDVRIEDATFSVKMLWGNLWGIATHEGRLPGTPRGIAARMRVTGPLTPLSKALAELERRGCIARYLSTDSYGCSVWVYELVRYKDNDGLTDNRRYPSKIPPGDRYPGRVVDEKCSEPEAGAQDQRSPEAPAPKPGRSHLEVVPQPLRDQEGKREEGKRAEASGGVLPLGLAVEGGREGLAGAHRQAGAGARAEALAAKAAHTPDERQLVLDVAPGMRERADRWLAELGRRRASLAAEGVVVQPVELSDVLLVALEVRDEYVFQRAVEIHCDESPDRWWRTPLASLRHRVGFARARIVDELRAAKAVGTPPEVPAKTSAPSSSPSTSTGEVTSAPSSPKRAPPSDEHRKAWAQVLEELRGEVEPYDYKHWLKPVGLASVDVDTRAVALSAPDDSHARWVDEHFGELLRATLARVFGGAWSVRYDA